MGSMSVETSQVPAACRRLADTVSSDTALRLIGAGRSRTMRFHEPPSGALVRV